MTVLQFHILLEQMLQQMGNFSYDDLEREEVDVAINYGFDKAIRHYLSPKDDRQAASASKDGFEDIQLTLDDLRMIKVEDVSLAGLVNVGTTKTRGNLPDGYRGLINDRSVVKLPDCDAIEKPNRLTDSEIVKNLLETELGGTNAESPISTMSDNRLTVYRKGFDVTDIVIDYYKKPAKVDYNAPANGAGVIEFPDSTCYKFADKLVVILSSWLEQPQLKVEYLKQIANDNA